MGILVGLIWVVIGIVYIIYQGFKEKPRTTIAVFKIIGLFICLFILPAILVNLVIEMGGFTSWILSVLVALIPFVSLAVGAIHIINKIDDANTKRFSPDGIEKKCAEMTQLFKQNGYFVSASMVNRLVLDYASPLYKSEKIKVPIHECYKWLCVNRELELERKSDDELGEILGVVFESIPLNDSKELGAAVLQRRALAIKYILERDGLSITEHSSRRHWLNDTSDYPQKFVQYVNEGVRRC